MFQTFRSMDAFEIAPMVSSYISQIIGRQINCRITIYTDDPYLGCKFEDDNRMTNDEVREVFASIKDPSEDHLASSLSEESDSVPDLGEEFILDILKQHMDLEDDVEMGLFHGRLLIRMD